MTQIPPLLDNSGTDRVIEAVMALRLDFDLVSQPDHRWAIDGEGLSRAAAERIVETVLGVSDAQAGPEYRVRWEDDHCMYPADDLSSVESLIAWRARFSDIPVAAVERREVGPWRSVHVREGEMTTEEDVRRDTITRNRK